MKREKFRKKRRHYKIREINLFFQLSQIKKTFIQHIMMENRLEDVADWFDNLSNIEQITIQ